ncbi:MAG TPA: hypothetical protein VN721_07040 [Flavipsychrobacter sp.]|nr:hypothetical protein [Flavipsychrobacter sp.]
MKKLLLSVVAIVCITAASAQTHTLLIYANTYISSENSDYSSYQRKTIAWGPNLGVGYQLDHNMTIGIQGIYDFMKTPVGAAANNNFTISEWTLGAFYRYTIYTKTMLFFYAQVDAGYANGSASEEDLGAQATYTGFRGMVYPAIGAFVSPSIAVTFNVGGGSYRTYNWTANYAGIENSNRSVLTFGRQFNLGVSKNIGWHPRHLKKHHQ